MEYDFVFLCVSHSLTKALQNHDNQANITHIEEIRRELEVAPLSYTRTAPSGIGGFEGPGTYWVPVYTRATGM